MCIDSMRISGAQILSQGKIMMTIFGVYLPHYNGDPEQIQLYAETLDLLQSLIDDCDESPSMIVGDFNASLPRQQNINWYKKTPF